ncbi:MFS transporter [Enterovirga aerilata]|uniref:MFS transporter n=1 Tax=Enterovirga aerilata TaxID=2730920 RepID=A0A849I330_9HYPH|nr:MFS transporter [Enterovirga sp. DB1703]NNM72044.1 MFS transporter [Enterovirga sp. DB1703]
MVTRGLVWRLGFSQLLCWGVSYYLVAIFGERIGNETGWSGAIVYGGFSAALVTMGMASPAVGRAIDRHGGRTVMTAGSVLMAASCLLLAAATNLVVFYAAWLLLGVAMRMSLYDAAFATLVRLAGPQARRPISQITLLGGLASTALWPVGARLADLFGWRGALVCYAAIALATVPLHLAIPAGRFTAGQATSHRASPRPLATTPREKALAAGLFALSITLGAILNSALSAHMIALLHGLGMGLSAAVWASSLRGIGQSLARLCEIATGSRLSPLALGVLATAIIPLGFVAGLFAGVSPAAGLAFAFLYGAGFGLVTITRGTQPLVLFDPASYGTISGRLLAPSFYLSALSPTAFAWIIDRFGPEIAMQTATALAIAVLLSSALLWWSFRDRRS